MSDFDWVQAVNQQESQLVTKARSLNISGTGTGTRSARGLNAPVGGISNAANGNPAELYPPIGPPSSSTGVTSPTYQSGTSPIKDHGDDGEDDTAITAEEASLLRKIVRDKLVHSGNQVVVERSNPNSPLYSAKSFEELNLSENILRGLYSLGFIKPSKIQETALPLLLAHPHNNLIAQSQSGTGKTAAFLVAMLSKVDPSLNHPQILCLSPTFELALQTGDVGKQMAKYYTDIRFKFAVRGERVRKGDRITEHIIIGTPGTMLDWANKFRVLDMNKIVMFVLDEADVMIATQGHQDQSIRIHKLLNPECQMVLFSATYDSDVINFALKIIPDAITIRLRREEESLDNIKQYYVLCKDREEKFEALSNLYAVITVGQAMIFTRTKRASLWLAERMVREGHAVALLNGDLDISQRIAVLNRFREGKEKVLISTNVSSRGIDVEQVSLVINYDIPTDLKKEPDYETYLHRIGRTGRFGKSGIAINFVSGETDLSLVRSFESHFGRKIIPLSTDDVDDIERIQT